MASKLAPSYLPIILSFFGCRINIFEQWQWAVISSSFLSLITRCAPCAAAALFSASPQITHTNMCGRAPRNKTKPSIHPSSASPKVAPIAEIDRLGAFVSEKQCGSMLARPESKIGSGSIDSRYADILFQLCTSYFGYWRYPQAAEIAKKHSHFKASGLR